MLRAAAKNHERVTVLVDPGGLRGDARRASRWWRLRGDATAPCGEGVWHIRPIRRARLRLAPRQQGDASFPDALAAGLSEAPGPALRREPAPARRLLRRPARRRRIDRDGAPAARARNSPSTTSRMPTRRSSACASSTTPACVIVKHANPCGVGHRCHPSKRPTSGPTKRTRHPPSAASSPSIDRSMRATAAAIVERQFVEVIVAPAFAPDALAALAAKAEHPRCSRPGRSTRATSAAVELKSVAGGLLRADAAMTASSTRRR